MRRFFAVFLILFALLAYIAPFNPTEVRADSLAPCGVSHYNISDPLNYIYLGNTIMAPCPLSCPPELPDVAAGHLDGDINSPAVDFWCAGSPLPPDKPAINAGQVCVAGSSRTVNIVPQGGTTHEIEINPGGVVNLGSGTSHTFTGLMNGVNYTFRAQSSDAYGSSGWTNWTAVVRHDTSAPVTTIDLVGISGANGWYTSDVSVALLSTDSGCLGTAQTVYALNGSNQAYSAPFNVTAEGSNNLVVSATDGYHVEPAQNRIIQIDQSNPTLSLSPDRSPDAPTGWWTAPVSVTVNAADAISGVDQVDYALNGGGWIAYATPITISGDGVHDVDAQVVDVAGLTAFDGVVIRLDATPPTLSLSTDRPVDVPSGWWTAPVTVTLNVTDATSGLDGTVYSVDGGATWQPYTAPFTLSADGLHTADVVSRDQAGNINSQSATIGIDQTPPQMQLAISAVQGENGWLVSQPVVSLLNTDLTSGISEMVLVIDGVEQPYTAPVTITTEGEHTVSFRVVDGANNVQTGDPVTIYVDHLQPFGELQIDGETGSGDWYRTPPILRMSRTDSMSGVAGSTLWINGSESAYGSAFQINAEGWHTIVYSTRDFAGNSTASQTVELGVDRTAPTIQDVEVTCGGSIQAQISDSLSGVVRVEVSVDGVVTASDVYSGRTDAFSVSYPANGDEIRLLLVDAAGNEARITRDCTTGLAIVPADSPDESGTPPISGGEPPIFWVDETPETLLPAVTPLPNQTVIVPPGVELWADNQPQVNPVLLTPPVLGEVRLGVDVWEDQSPDLRLPRLPVQPIETAPRIWREDSVALSDLGLSRRAVQPRETAPLIWGDEWIMPVPRVDPQALEMRRVERSAPPVGTDALPGALAALGALATVAAGVVTTTASSRQRQAEQASQRATAEAALAQQVADQAQRDDAKQAENASLREAAETIAYVDAAISDRKQMYYDLVSGYADRVRLWQEAVVVHQTRDMMTALQAGLQQMDGLVTQKERQALEAELRNLEQILSHEILNIQALALATQGIIGSFEQVKDVAYKRLLSSAMDDAASQEENRATTALRHAILSDAMANNDSLSLSHINRMESLYELGRYENLHATALSNFRLASIINQATEHEELIKETLKHYQAAISNSFGYTFTGKSWSLDAVQNIHDASELTARAFAHWVENEAKLGSVDRYQLYRRIMGPLEFFNSDKQSSSDAYAETQNSQLYPDSRRIEVFSDANGQQRVMSVNNVIHELGHLFNGNAGPGGPEGIATINSLAQDLFGDQLSRDGMGHPDPSTLIDRVRADTLQQSNLNTNNEIVADAFLNWVYTINTRNQSGFSTIPGLSLKFPKLSELVNSQLEEIPYQFAAGEEWFDFMNSHMGQWMRNAIILHNPNADFVLSILERVYDVEAMEISNEDVVSARRVRSLPDDTAPSWSIIVSGDSFVNSTSIKVLGKYEPTELLEERSTHWLLIAIDGRIGWVASRAFSLDLSLIPTVDPSLISPTSPFNLEVFSVILEGE